MRLLNRNLEFCDFDDVPPPYAIFSHTWSERNEEEVTYQDLKDGTTTLTKSLLKVNLCREWAMIAELEYFWIDTCCIDKRNEAELNYSIRSMWRWYSQADICFVYLSDLSKKRKQDTDWRDTLKDCKWFTRGWTLQELVAPKRIEFYARDGRLGSREDLLPALKSITGIDLGGPMPSYVTRLSWATNRVTKRPEDRAYCMLGICDVSLGPRYGEGPDSAWRRLQDAIRLRHGTIALEVQPTATNGNHRATVLEALRFDALEKRRENVKVALATTCKWILSHPACAKWLKREHKFFWIKGKPGAGKSVLIKYLDQHVTRKLKKSNAIGLYFYFNARGEQLEKSFMGLYRSLLVQLVDRVPELEHELDALNAQFDLLQLQKVLTSVIRGLDKQIWLFIDALDECREGDVRELIEFLDGLKEAELYVCFASRHYPIAEVPTNLQLVLEELDQHEQDLRTYVEKIGLEGEELALMQREIVAKANGIFLWVVLVVKILQKDFAGARFHAMLSRLREIPEDLTNLFRTIIFRDNKHKEEFLLCLLWILYAWRPLTLKEWFFAMMAGLDVNLEWLNTVTDQRMETFLLSSSKGLAELTKGKTATPQFIHESVREYLIKEGGFEEICGSYESFESIAHEQLKYCCLRGMEFSLPRQLEQRKGKKQLLDEEEHRLLRDKHPFAEYATTHILHHADQAAVGICQQHFLAKEFKMSNWTCRSNAFQISKPNVYSDVPSFSYLCAERNLARLIPRPTEALSLDAKQRYEIPLIAAIVHSSWEVVWIFLEDMNVPNIDETIEELKLKASFRLSPRSLQSVPGHWTVMNGLVHLSKHILTSVPEEEVRAPGGMYGDGLRRALCEGHEQLVQVLLDAGGKVDADALQAASSGGHVKMVQMLLDAGADANTDALQVASSRGHEKVVQMLLYAGAEANANMLQVASSRGYDKVVKMLLDAGVEVNAQGGTYGNALQAASYKGYDHVVQMLLKAGAEVNAQGGFYGNALQAASYKCHEYVVQMLLQAGAEANAQGGQYDNALRAALSDGHDRACQIVDKAGVEVNAQREGFELQAISFGNREEVVQMLLDAGAQVDLPGGDYGNALQTASYRGYEHAVQMLLKAGADANVQGGFYGNALQAASYRGHDHIVQMLLDAGAEGNAQGGLYKNALEAALEGGYEKVVQMLIDVGLGQ